MPPRESEEPLPMPSLLTEPVLASVVIRATLAVLDTTSSMLNRTG